MKEHLVIQLKGQVNTLSEQNRQVERRLEEMVMENEAIDANTRREGETRELVQDLVQTHIGRMEERMRGLDESLRRVDMESKRLVIMKK